MLMKTDSVLTIIDQITFEAVRALDAEEVRAVGALLDLVRVVVVAAEPEVPDTTTILRAITELVESTPELGQVLEEVAALVEQLDQYVGCSDDLPCDECLRGAECPVPGCEDELEFGDPAGPW